MTVRLTHLEGYGLPREGFDENLHAGVQSTYTKNNKVLCSCFNMDLKVVIL